MKRAPDAIEYARILIVDDELHNRSLIEVMLKPEGFSLQTAKSGEEALAMVGNEHPDLILLDVMMPGMDGYAVVTAIKSSPATKHIPIIMVTARDDRESRLHALTAGAEDFLTKPVDRAELTVRVRNLLRLKAYGDFCDKYAQKLKRAVRIQTEALRAERDKAQAYLDTAQVILLKLDVNRRITLINEYACELLGRTHDELLGVDWVEMCVPARARDEVLKKFDDLILAEYSIVENPVVTKSGDELDIEWRNRLMRDETGSPIGTFSSGTDITERNKATEALRTAEERIRFALEAAGVGIWDVDYATGVVRWSEILEGQYGLKPGAFAGTFKAFLDCVHPEDRESLIESMKDSQTTGNDFASETRSVWPDGTVRLLTGFGRVHLDKNGKPVRGVGISLDVTDQRMLQGQLQQAQKMEAIGQLASGVAHDFNNLLTVILGFSDLLAADQAMSSEHVKELGEIIKAAKRATGLTMQLLAFSRQQVLHAAPLDLNELITGMSGMLRMLVGEQVAITELLAPNLPLAIADRGQIEQVVMNLVVNARDAMPGGGRLTIETSEIASPELPFSGVMASPAAYVMLSITDTGTGMTKETQRRLFEPFFSTKEIGKGTGLGLSTTYGIVKQSQGYVWVSSELGIGTTFKVCIPRCESRVQDSAGGVAIPLPTSSALETILLVEDEAGVRQLSKRILENAGYRVIEAADGAEAERLFLENKDTIHLVVTDVVMPGLNGPEMFARLLAIAPELKVLYMSGYTEQSAAAKAGLDNGVPFIQKPFTGGEFTSRLRKAFDFSHA